MVVSSANMLSSMGTAAAAAKDEPPDGGAAGTGSPTNCERHIGKEGL